MRIKAWMVACGLAVCLLAQPVAAGQLEDGWAAHERGDYATALQLWRPLAEQGVAGAQFNLGVIYDKGQGVPQDYAEAVKWYRKAADQGYADAQTNLGVMYDNGQGMPLDDAEAAKWYRKAAEQGNTLAQTNLGRLYYNGSGMPQDFAQAHMWFNLAAAGGDADAKNVRDALSERMTPDQIAEAQRLAREWLAAHPKQ